MILRAVVLAVVGWRFLLGSADFVTIAALLGAAALAYCWLPARAATKIHPLALRCD
jgi:ABC-type antimicrobial peptide transport system permease subunit